MRFGLRFLLVVVAGLPAVLGCGEAPPPDPVGRQQPKPEGPARLPAVETPVIRARFEELNRADVVFTADIADFESQGAMMSLPPILLGRLQLKNLRMLKGEAPSTLETRYSFKSPFLLKVEPKRERRVFGGHATSNKENPFNVTVCIPAGEDNLALARAAVALPVGWSIDGGRPVCPWTAPALGVPGLEGSCVKCGRPPLRAGAGIDVTVERVPVDTDRKSDVTMGGIFRITVSNRGAKPAEIPALLGDDRGIRWPDSLVVVTNREDWHEGTVRLLPPGAAPQGRIRPAVLAPGESSSVTVDLYQFGLDENIGEMIQVQFALGERSCRDSFYHNIVRR